MEQEEGHLSHELAAGEPMAKRQRTEEAVLVHAEGTSIEYQFSGMEEVNQAYTAVYQYEAAEVASVSAEQSFVSEEGALHETLLPSMPAHPWHIDVQENYFQQLYVADEFEHCGRSNNFLKLARWYPPPPSFPLQLLSLVD